MRIIIVGRSEFGKNVLERFISQGEEVVGVIAPPSTENGKADPLAVASASHGIAVCTESDLKSEAVVRAYQDMAPSLVVLAFVTKILPEKLLTIPEYGTICFHPSLLPHHRGPNAVGWAILQGESYTGLTIFWIDGGIDTGPILLQQRVDIGDNDTTGSLLMGKLFPMGVEAIAEAVRLVKNEDPPKIVQDEELATYEPTIDETASRIDWRRSITDIANKIRGCDPLPGAWTGYKGRKIRCYGIERSDESAFSGIQSGTIVEISLKAIYVQTKNGILGIQKIKDDGGNKGSSFSFATNYDVSTGDCFTDF
ncbi:MAG: methionyl-tRNA formyltransferase [Desulfobacterales bacterium]|nr:methionyl-tRNA formyltransferase [Desulfobacterales bacterium]